MGWGAKLIGFGSVMNALDDIQVKLDDDVVYVVGTNVEYAIYQEFGTRNMEPNSFLFPAAREAQRNVQTIAGDANSVEEAVKRISLFIEKRAAEEAPVDTGNLQASVRSEKIRG